MENRFTKEQIIKVLKKLEGGRPATDIVREPGIAEQTFYSWKRKYSDMNVSEVKRLKQLEAKNAKLKELVADISLDNKISEKNYAVPRSSERNSF